MAVICGMNEEQMHMEVSRVVRNLQLATKLAFPHDKLVPIESTCVSENHLFCHRFYTFSWSGTVKAWSDSPRVLWNLGSELCTVHHRRHPTLLAVSLLTEYEFIMLNWATFSFNTETFEHLFKNVLLRRLCELKPQRLRIWFNVL